MSVIHVADTKGKTYSGAPKGNGPLSSNLASMEKGQAWVNGQSIERYWSSYLAPSTGCNSNCDYQGSYDASKCLKNCGQPAQIVSCPWLLGTSWGKYISSSRGTWRGLFKNICFNSNRSRNLCTCISVRSSSSRFLEARLFVYVFDP